jgi:hypothetical protein
VTVCVGGGGGSQRILGNRIAKSKAYVGMYALSLKISIHLGAELLTTNLSSSSSLWG